MNPLASPRRSAAILALCLGALAPGPAASLPVLSEVFYDASGSDDGLGFVELYGLPGSSLEGWSIEGVNGANGATTVTLSLSGTIPGDGILVIADQDDTGATGVADHDLLDDFDFQNGPDSVVLLDADGAVVDALGYGVFEAGEVFAGEGLPAPDASAGSSLERVFADVDTDVNLDDWHLAATPTPGSVVLQNVPEPAPALLFAVGLAGLALCGHRPPAGSGATPPGAPPHRG